MMKLKQFSTTVSKGNFAMLFGFIFDKNAFVFENGGIKKKHIITIKNSN